VIENEKFPAHNFQKDGSGGGGGGFLCCFCLVYVCLSNIVFVLEGTLFKSAYSSVIFSLLSSYPSLALTLLSVLLLLFVM